jgi:hypothetical protein
MKKKILVSSHKINFNPELLISLGIKHVKVNSDSIFTYAGHFPISAVYISKGQVDVLKNNIVKDCYKENYIVGFLELLNSTPLKFDIKIRYGSELYLFSKDNLKMLMNLSD